MFSMVFLSNMFYCEIISTFHLYGGFFFNFRVIFVQSINYLHLGEKMYNLVFKKMFMKKFASNKLQEVPIMSSIFFFLLCNYNHQIECIFYIKIYNYNILQKKMCSKFTSLKLYDLDLS